MSVKLRDGCGCFLKHTDLSLSYLVKIGLIWLLLMCSGGYYGRKMKLLGEVQWIPHYKLLQIKFSETTAIRNKKQSF